ALAGIVERAASRRGLAAPGPQRMVAEHATLVELDAAILAERMPRRRAALESIVRRASAERGAAPDVFAQVEANARASLAIALVALAGEEVSQGSGRLPSPSWCLPSRATPFARRRRRPRHGSRRASPRFGPSGRWPTSSSPRT
ncbi:MAG: hypothetical protein ACKOJI_05150, partial [Phycisphaerales bacterium]